MVAALALFAVNIPVDPGWGQIQAAKVTLIHPWDGQKHSFEVATIKPNADMSPGTRIQFSTSRVSMTNTTVRDLIRLAYGIKSDQQLVGEPSWLKTERFDIDAKLSDADGAVFDKLGFAEKGTLTPLLLQSLLIDRFHLKEVVELHDLPAYALLVASGGIKMKEVKPDPLPPFGVAPAPGAHLPTFRRTGQDEFTASAWPMPQLADRLSNFYEVGDRPVVDETGLKGSYDFVLRDVAIRPPQPDDANATGAQSSEISLFAALSEQLGLKLVPVKAPTEVLVIESIERPSPN
jgi:uncharacterized protein (TIGR03435 family)